LMRWLRLYDDTINDPKILKLPEATRWHWIAMLCIASKNEGVLPALDDIAIQLRVTAAKATEIIAVLVKAGLLDKTETGFEPHNWSGRQYHSDSSAERMRRHRSRKRPSPSDVTGDDSDGGGDVTVTLQIQNTDTDTEAEKKETREDALLAEFDPFWEIWPNKVGKPAALKAYRSARKRGVAPDAIIEGVRTYIRNKPPDRPWLNPATFLNQNRWEDRPAQVANGKNSEVSAACDTLIDRLNAGFGGPPPEERFRGGEGEADARMLAYRGR
jgi:hypothetical protein